MEIEPGKSRLPLEMDATGFQLWLEKDGEQIDLIDVREMPELVSGGIAGARHCPLSKFMELFPKFSRQRLIGVYCAHGVRSLDVVGFLRGQGFTAVSLRGGIEAWPKQLVPVTALS